VTKQTQLYDRIGKGYSANRRSDPRIAKLIYEGLGNAATVLNVGAGTGSYEPDQVKVIAVEPSWGMIKQRPAQAAPAVRAFADALPFQDNSFDASMAILTVHHWPDPVLGLRALTRISRQRVVILTWDPAFPGFWLTRDYFTELNQFHREMFPELETYQKVMGDLIIQEIPIPHDCLDGFLGAYWQRPQAYLDPKVRGSMSTFSRIKREAEGVAALEKDLASGAWKERYAGLLSQESCDLGYRLLIKELV
jgi:SAM-dependent methyltransferase